MACSTEARFFVLFDLFSGNHQHAALPLKSGERTNLVIWMYGEGGAHHRCSHFEYSMTEKDIFKEKRWKLHEHRYNFNDNRFKL